ncbi:hypothetical protein STEG23_014240 [Scotinomys teguina]
MCRALEHLRPGLEKIEPKSPEPPHGKGTSPEKTTRSTRGRPPRETVDTESVGRQTDRRGLSAMVCPEVALGACPPSATCSPGVLGTGSLPIASPLGCSRSSFVFLWGLHLSFQELVTSPSPPLSFVLLKFLAPQARRYPSAGKDYVKFTFHSLHWNTCSKPLYKVKVAPKGFWKALLGKPPASGTWSKQLEPEGSLASGIHETHDFLLQAVDLDGPGVLPPDPDRWQSPTADPPTCGPQSPPVESERLAQVS